jgi:pimeloyl-ACP methyl ester carboxylesterase
LLAFEMVGYGESIPAGRDRDISVARQADYLLAWLNHLDIEQAVLAGHDLGGGVAQIAAVHQPRRCAGLVLANAICSDSWPIPSVLALQAAGPLVSRLPMPALRALVGSLVARGHDDPAIARESLAIHLEPCRRHGGAAALAWQVRWLRTADILQVATGWVSCRCPPGWYGAPPTVPAAVVRAAAGVGPAHGAVADRGRPALHPEDHAERLAAAVDEVLGAVGSG